MDNTTLVKTLNELLEYLNDSQEGYQQCVGSVTDRRMAELFDSLAMKRRKMANELGERIKILGGSPKESGSITGVMHRLYVNLKSAITGGDIDAIINEIKRGENTVINCYKEALRKNFTADVHSVLNSHLNEIEGDIASMDKLSVVS